jgi:uncharacterized metal-binding protein YceD (DUF177 family)
MKVTNEYLIPFIGLKLGKHKFDFNVNEKFFEAFEYEDFENPNIKVELILEKKSTLLELQFKHSGTVLVPCDVTGELFDLPIKGKLKLVVNFGESFNNDNEELLILPHGEHQIDVSQFIYEMIVLSVPFKRVHPGVKDGTLNTSESKTENSVTQENTITEENTEQETDPRWDKLKKLLTDK